MSRSTAARTKQLHSEIKRIFKGVYAEPFSEINTLVENALNSVNSDIYGVSLTPHINNRWSIFMMYGNSEKLIDVDMNNVKADVNAFISDVKCSGGLFVDRFHDHTREQEVKRINDLIAEWVVLDSSKLNRKIKRVKSDIGDLALDELNLKARILRRELWDLEDAIKAHLNKPTLTLALQAYKENFPLAVEAALAHSTKTC